MRPLFATIALTLCSPLAVAQSCFDGDFGTLIGTNTQDLVLPIEPIGFAYPVGGVTYTHVHVTDHGFVQLSNNGVPAPATGAVLYTPSTANFTAGSAKVCALYTDVIAAGGGTIYIKSGPAQCTVTWRNMTTFGAPTTAPRFDFQLTLFPNGDARVVYGPGCTNASTFGGVSDNGIAGITPGGGAVLPASSDLSAGGSSIDPTVYENWVTANTFDMANNTLLMIASNPGYSYVTLGAPTNCAAVGNYGTGCGGLGASGFGLPSVGNANFRLDVTGVPAASPIAFVAFGSVVVNPGIPLGSIGMAGCSGYTNLDLGMFGTGPVTAGTAAFTLSIPANPALAGSVLSAQSVALSATTALGLVAGNGTQVSIGFGF